MVENLLRMKFLLFILGFLLSVIGIYGQEGKTKIKLSVWRALWGLGVYVADLFYKRGALFGAM